jgi:hypothetical protein
MKLDRIDKKLLGLIEKIINISEETLKESKQLPPTLLIFESNGKESLHRFAEGNMKELQVKAQEYIKENAKKILYCALSYDGTVTISSNKTDAIIVIGYGKNEEDAYIFAEKYCKDEKNIKFDGEISFIDQEKNLLK